MAKFMGPQMPYIKSFFLHDVKRKLILKKILHIALGKLICFITEQRLCKMT